MSNLKNRPVVYVNLRNEINNLNQLIKEPIESVLIPVFMADYEFEYFKPIVKSIISDAAVEVSFSCMNSDSIVLSDATIELILTIPAPYQTVDKLIDSSTLMLTTVFDKIQHVVSSTTTHENWLYDSFEYDSKLLGMKLWDI